MDQRMPHKKQAATYTAGLEICTDGSKNATQETHTQLDWKYAQMDQRMPHKKQA
jgi:hypothetical protein